MKSVKQKTEVIRMKERYLDLVEKAVAAYSEAQIAEYTARVKTEGLSEHGYPRLTANVGILLAHGRAMHRLAYWPAMMEFCCREFLLRGRKKGIGNDFSVKEIVFCLEEVEAAGLLPKSVTDGWRMLLAQIDPYKTYNVIAERPPKPIGNWAAFAALSEQARIAAGIGAERDFVENQIQSQLFSFDENGMYRDPNEPMVYDFVTRLQLAAALAEGYDGEGRARLEDFLDRAAIPTLLMQSVTGEIPFGGRSNQFLHNETFYAALCEFYAARFAAKGDRETAGQFRRAAHRAADSLTRWLAYPEVHHVKNRFPLSGKIGCEGYGYFEKYMVTMGSWAYLAYRLSDDTIEERPCPSETGGFVWKTSEHFHKVMLNAGGYFAEFDTNADPHYDGSGLGRIHKAGAPSALCLSVPFAESPLYGLPQKNPGPLAIAPGSCSDGEWAFGSAVGAVWEKVSSYADDGEAAATFRVVLTNGTAVSLNCLVNAGGVTLTVRGEGRVGLELPVFLTDGEEKTAICVNGGEVTASCAGFSSVCTSSAQLTDTGVDYVNRNGVYRRFTTEADGVLIVRVKIGKE